MLTTKFEKFGDGYVLPLSKQVLEQAHIDRNFPVNITVSGSVIVISQTDEMRYAESAEVRQARKEIHAKYGEVFQRLADS